MTGSVVLRARDIVKERGHGAGKVRALRGVSLQLVERLGCSPRAWAEKGTHTVGTPLLSARPWARAL
jgi:hypothetical protein